MALGSPGYAAPEQYGKAQTTARTDIYSLGALLHFLLSGDDPAEHPFQFAPLEASVPVELNTSIFQMLEIDPARRPESIDIIKRQLERLITQQRDSVPGVLPPFRLQWPTKPAIQSQQQKPIFSEWKNPVHEITGIVWSPCGTRVAAVHANGTVQIIDAFTGNMPGSYNKHIASSVACGHVISWSPDGKRLASSGDYGDQIWDAETGDELLINKDQVETIHEIRWSPDGQYIASLASSGKIRVWEATTGHTFLIKRGLSSQASTLAWSPDGKYLAAEQDNTHAIWSGNKAIIGVWDAVTGEDICRYKEHSYRISNIVWSSAGTKIASAGRIDPMVSVWNAFTGKTLLTYRHHASHGLQVQWLPSNNLIVSVDCKGEVHVWDCRKGEVIAIYRAYSNDTMDIWPSSWSPNGQYLAFTKDDKKVQIWALPTACLTFNK
jgi:WD40 repeat protein